MQLIYKQLLKQAKKLAPIPTAIVHPMSEEALSGAMVATQHKLIIPVFVGPSHKIKKIAQNLKVDLASYEIIHTEHSHAAAKEAVLLSRTGKVKMLMKGGLHTDEFMKPIVNSETGLRTERRMSHVFSIQVSTYPKLLLLTDCALNIQPTLMEKRDIVQNAIDLARAIGIKDPKVAVLSATEMVSEKLKSTLDAAALCKMAEREQIISGIIDGPLAFDNAISKKASAMKHIHSKVAGQADILLAPDLEAGNMLAKQLQYLASASLAGVALGARIPIVLTSRADNAETRLYSCVLSRLYGEYLEKGKLCKKHY